MYYVYMLRCKDNSIYTGITSDLGRRMNEHFNKNSKCAKYTLHHTADKIEKVWKTENRVLASKMEYRIKHLNKFQKEDIIENSKRIEDFFGDKLNCKLYSDISVCLRNKKYFVL